MHERAVNCGPQAERGQGPVSLEVKQMAKWEAVASHEETQSVVPEAVRDFNPYFQASEETVPQILHCYSQHYGQVNSTHNTNKCTVP